ncbi:hypothetical protein PLICRDRAFT_47413 [Plicaturopsis crispa FD-325 SS-3]|uniref:Enoyl reductase (ER) domain-containing protein n=1 Tax=Plicaturopsis crispa FD-325 SS-3 TaxID=944288 RepID=A0A0C9T4M2_PLICR|nr:hypothetical protein PLICRDRAFT_47413 [Plicaturopsis crispa FD-325 SS-3]
MSTMLRRISSATQRRPSTVPPPIPPVIHALVSQPGNTVAVQDIPFEDEVAPHQVIIHVRAVGLNPTDWKYALGDWGAPGFVVGCDAAGDVVRVGTDVHHLRVGDRAAGFTQGTTDAHNGAFAEYVRFDCAVVFRIPDLMKYDEAASLPMSLMTAAQALHMRFKLPVPNPPNPPAVNGPTILIWGGSTSVGTHAIQLARLAGADVLAAAYPSKAAFEALRELGVRECIDYQAKDAAHAIRHAAKARESTDGSPKKAGVQFALDCVCDERSTKACIDAIGRRGGVVATLLPVSEKIKRRRADVRVEFTLVFSDLGHPVTFANLPTATLPAMPDDRAHALAYVSTTLPALFQWQKGGGVGGAVRIPALKRMPGGLARIAEGLELMQRGEYGREKLVYSCPRARTRGASLLAAISPRSPASTAPLAEATVATPGAGSAIVGDENPANALERNPTTAVEDASAVTDGGSPTSATVDEEPMHASVAA